MPHDGPALAFEGFGHHALITICALMILGRGLVVTGALDLAARALRSVRQFNQHIGLLVALMVSMVINDTPALVLMLPILVQLAHAGGMPSSKTLIPVNAAILMGGMATTIDTSTNLLVVSIATDLGLPPIGVFHFTPLVFVAALIALPYIWLIMPRLLPDNSHATAPDERRYCTTLRLSEEMTAQGRTVDQIRSILPASITIDPYLAAASVPHGRLNIAGTHGALEEAARLRQEANAAGEDLALVEMTVTPYSRLIGLTLQTAGLEDAAVLGVYQTRGFHDESRIESAEAPLREGDVLLVMATTAQADAFAAQHGARGEVWIDVVRSPHATELVSVEAWSQVRSAHAG